MKKIKKLTKSIIGAYIPRSLKFKIISTIKLSKYILKNKNLRLRTPEDYERAKKFLKYREQYNKHEWENLTNNLLLNMDQKSRDFIKLYELRMNYIFSHNVINRNVLFTNEEKREQKVCNKELVKMAFKYRKFKLSFINDECFYGYSGLRWLPQEQLKKLQHGICIDGGGGEGDTAIIFADKFKVEKIHVYEIEKINYKKLLKTAQKIKNNIIQPKFIGLSDENGIASVAESRTSSVLIKNIKTPNNIKIRKLDDLYSSKEKISLIKLDVEGSEQNVLKGAENIIKRDKPILAISIYHSPEDFYLIKPWLASINNDYKFAIKKASPFSLDTEIMLLAY